MLSAIPLWLVVAQSLAVPVPAAGPAQPQSVVQIVRTRDGKVTTERRAVEPGLARATAIRPDGEIIESTAPGEKRVLIELREPPTRHARRAGSAAEAGRQRAQLVRDLAAINARLNPRVPARVRRHFETFFSGVAATVDPAALEEIRRLPYVLAVHEDVRVRAQLADSVPMIGATSVAATYGVTGAGITVAVIDTGIDYTHPDLGGCFGAACKVAGGYDFVNDDADPRDDHGHGTHVAGIVAANGTVKGVAPGAKLLAYKVLDVYGSGSTSDIIAAIEQAVLDGAKVANLSIGGPGNPDDPTSQAIDNAAAAGMLSVVAAGNSGPRYRTVQSPGVARTALTVGATTKNGVVASFSSRGYVADGGTFVMKPEMTAPGVAIRSTLMGGGHGAMDGTSMAAPHVAGAAALLLHWNGTQTPADLKRRLVASANWRGYSPFADGVGLVDLVKAFSLRVLPSITHVPFGAAAGTSGVEQFQQTFSVSNTTNASEVVSFAAGLPALPNGATMTIAPASVVVPAGQSANVTVTLEVNKAVTPEPPDPLAWNTRVVMTAGGATANVPVYFFRGSKLNLTLDEAPWYVYVASPERGVLHTFEQPGASFSAVLPSGTWDVLALYNGHPSVLVVREQQNVQGELSLSLQRSEATRKVTVRMVDKEDQPLRFGSSATLNLGLKPGAAANHINILFGFNSWGADFRVSPLSPRYVTGVLGGGSDAESKRWFTYSWSGSGLSSDVSLPSIGAPMRELTQSAPRPPGAASGFLFQMLGHAVRFDGDLGLAIHFGVAYPNQMDWKVYFQWTFTPGLPFHYTQFPSLSWYDASVQTEGVMGTNLRHAGGDELLADREPFFDMIDASHEPDVVLGPSITRWDVDTPPASLPLQLTVVPAGLSWSGGHGAPAWWSNTLSQRWRVNGVSPPYTLFRNGVPVRTEPLYRLEGPPIPYTHGAHELHATTQYWIGTTSASSKAVLSFDTVKADPTPPWMTTFRIEQDGQRTATPAAPSAALDTYVKFGASDNVAVTGAVLEWRQHGTNTWTPLPLAVSNGEVSNNEYTAPFQLEGTVDLRLTLTDGAGNSFREEWIPAAITSGSAPPTRPASITASRSGNAISISWTPSSSGAGIARYRVERLPGGESLLTSGPVTAFLDDYGLVSGNAYFYRVVAIDQNGVESAPSGYDAASLISFQDDPLVTGTPIRGVHVGELRLAVDKVRNAAGLPPAWTNYGPATGVVRAADFLELLAPLNAARAVVGLPAVQFSAIVGPGARIRASHVTQIRDAAK
jgi:subtilisin family serine protease